MQYDPPFVPKERKRADGRCTHLVRVEKQPSCHISAVVGQRQVVLPVSEFLEGRLDGLSRVLVVVPRRQHRLGELAARELTVARPVDRRKRVPARLQLLVAQELPRLSREGGGVGLQSSFIGRLIDHSSVISRWVIGQGHR